MKNLIQITTVLFLFVQTIAFGQTKDSETTSENQITETKIDAKNLKKFIGKYLLEEAFFELEIVQEDGKMYIITEFSKDELMHKNETTLSEPSRNVDFILVNGDKNDLKYSQNGYEAILKRVKPKAKE